MTTSIDPYAPPETASAPSASPPSPPLPRLRPRAQVTPATWTARSFKLLATCFLGLLATAAVGALVSVAAPHASAPHVVTVFLGLFTSLAVLGAYAGLHATIAHAVSRLPGKWAGAFLSFQALLFNALFAYVMLGLTLLSTGDFRRGRQLRRFGRVLLPPVEPGAGWTARSFEGLPHDARVTASQWRENGRTEHASVAAFAALTRDLMALNHRA